MNWVFFVKVLESSVQKIVLELIYKATSDFFIVFVLTLIVSSVGITTWQCAYLQIAVSTKAQIFQHNSCNLFPYYFTTLLEYQQLLTFYTKMNAYGIIKTIQMQKIHKM